MHSTDHASTPNDLPTQRRRPPQNNHTHTEQDRAHTEYTYIYIYIYIYTRMHRYHYRRHPGLHPSTLEHTYSTATQNPVACDWVRFVCLGAVPSTCDPPAAQDNPAKQEPAAGAVQGNGVGTFRLVGKTRVCVFGFRAHRVSENPAAQRKNIDLACVLCFPDFLSKHDFRT